MTRAQILELSLAICLLMLGYIASGIVHRTLRVKYEGRIIAAVGLVLVVINWG